MTELHILDHISTWRSDADQRQMAAYRRAGFSAAAAERSAASRRERTGDPTVAEIRVGGVRVGTVAVTVTGSEGRIEELWVEPEHADGGHGLVARRWAEQWCTEQGAHSVGIQLLTPDQLFADYPVRGQNRIKFIDTPTPLPEGVSSRPMTAEEYPAWLAAEQETYIFDIVRAGGMTPEQAEEKSDEDFSRLLPQGRETPGHSHLVMEADGRKIGTGWLNHGFLPGVTFGYSLFIEPEERGNGFGRAAMAMGEQATLASGDSALMFNVFGGNTVAMNLYTSAGFHVLTEYRSINLSAEEEK